MEAKLISRNNLFLVVKWILQTRLFFFILQVIASLFPDHQHSMTTVSIASYRLKPHPPAIEFLFGGFDNWDSEYYLNIANVGGYQIEECYAFFPLYPFLIRFTALFLHTLLGSVVPFHSLLVISSVFISNVAFILSSIILYLLTIRIFTVPADYSTVTSKSSIPHLATSNTKKSTSLSYSSCVPRTRRPLSSVPENFPSSTTPVLSTSSSSVPVNAPSVHGLPSSLNDPALSKGDVVKEMAFLSVLAYSVNPATVFMCSAYTESVFALFTFSGMLAISYSRPYIASLLFAGASGTRSNGIVLAGYIVYYHIIGLLKELHTHNSILGTGMRVLRRALEVMLQVPIVFFPFIAFQLYSYRQFCIETVTANKSLCNAMLPLPYSYIQAEYWGLGFLSFYELKQIPNFILAAPMFILAGIPLWRYCRKGFTNAKQWWINKQRFDKHQMYVDSVLLPYMVQLLFLILVAAFFMHIQVVTRFVASSSPVIYWFAGLVFLPRSTEISSTREGRSKGGSVAMYVQQLIKSGQWLNVARYDLRQLLVVYCIIYNMLGFAMHCNFLPWV